jgi:voltage-gated potassium channel
MSNPRSYDEVERRFAQRKVVFLLAVLVLVFGVGTLGYMELEEWNALDAFYMTVITLATIGYGEVHPLSTGGRVFTIALIFAGLGIFTVMIGSVSQAVLDRQFYRLFDRSRKMREQIDRVSNHTIFCGFSRLSRTAAAELRRAGEEIVVIESDQTRGREAEQAGFLVIYGDATLDESLTSAGVVRAKRLVTLLPRDSDNVYVTLTARELNASLYIVSRAEDEIGEKRLKRAGVNRLVSAYRLAARKLADGLMRPYITDFFEIAGTGVAGWKIEEIQVPTSSSICGKTLRDLALRQTANVSIAAIISPDGNFQLNPQGDTVLVPESTLIAVGWKADIETLEELVVGA